MNKKEITQREMDELNSKVNSFRNYLDRFKGALLDNALKNKVNKQLHLVGLSDDFYVEYTEFSIIVHPLHQFIIVEEPKFNYSNKATQDFMDIFNDIFNGKGI